MGAPARQLGGAALLVVAVTVFALTLGVALVSLCSSWEQLAAYQNVAALFALFGGSFLPGPMLSGWVQTVARATPIY
jgi:ABC-type uncharacterized transport system permease subunit